MEEINMNLWIAALHDVELTSARQFLKQRCSRMFSQRIENQRLSIELYDPDKVICELKHGLPRLLPILDTAAKSLVQGRCAIDMLAGPSEVLAIADESADPDTLAADMLAQAEHDTDARPILVTTDRSLADAVNARMAARLADLPTAATAAEACKKGFIVLCPDMDSAIAVSDAIAPEHLEIQTRDAQAVADRCLNYGGLFIGTRAAEVLGDYGAGPNHVLPTGGTAKYTGGLSVFNFVRIRTWMRIDDAAASQQVLLQCLVSCFVL